MNLYPWLNSIYNKIITYYKKKKIKNTFFLYSLSGIGGNILLKNICKWLICKNIKKKNCGICNNCILMNSKTHPDYFLINKINNNKNDINEFFNKLIDFINICAQEENIKVIYLQNPELLSENIIYKLLKIFKNYKKNVFFLIKCNKLSNLLINFKKNCFYLNLKIPNEKKSIKWLNNNINNNNINEIKTALYLNNGAPLLAKKMLCSKLWLQRNKIYKLLYNEIFNKKIFLLLNILKYKNLEQIFFWLYTLFIDIIKWKQKCKNYIINKDKKEIIKKLSNIINLIKLYNFIKKFSKFQYKIKNKKGINIEILFIEQIILLKKILNN
ncbi:DNA polymerase III subunit delta' [Enterobacterales bacterium endosymbiont of Anomoneura mori]|uniref:DNA polymerase III subunit delta' C-terminal domain-containing protein n=1 Tax=Enterobacterales bacterium endosymbiont of Anomoneura mori TaxID=3132096 RepID=UPI00399D26AD